MQKCMQLYTRSLQGFWWQKGVKWRRKNAVDMNWRRSKTTAAAQHWRSISEPTGEEEGDGTKRSGEKRREVRLSRTVTGHWPHDIRKSRENGPSAAGRMTFLLNLIQAPDLGKLATLHLGKHAWKPSKIMYHISKTYRPVQSQNIPTKATKSDAAWRNSNNPGHSRAIPSYYCLSQKMLITEKRQNGCSIHQ